MVKKKIKEKLKKVEDAMVSSGWILSETGTTTSPETVAQLILPLAVDLGREDLNTVVNKLNEVIEFINRS